jgi:hypothetical protein
VRYVVIEDRAQRSSICNALNQWLIASSAGTSSGIGAHFATSLELTPFADSVASEPSPANAIGSATPRQAEAPKKAEALPVPDPNLSSGAAANIHCPFQLPSGF